MTRCQAPSNPVHPPGCIHTYGKALLREGGNIEKADSAAAQPDAGAPGQGEAPLLSDFLHRFAANHNIIVSSSEKDKT